MPHPNEAHQRQATANRWHTQQVLSAHIPYRSPGWDENDDVVRFNSQLEEEKKNKLHTQQDCPIDMFELQDDYHS